MRWKRALWLAAGVALSLAALSGCGFGGGKAVRMNVAAPQGSVWGVAAETFAQLVEEKSGGRRNVEITYAPSDADAERMLQDLLDGKADADLRAVSDWQSRDARLSALSMPWLFADYADADERLFDGSGGEAVLGWLAEIGVEPLALAENGFLQVTNDRRPITAPADFRGLTVRVPKDAPDAALFTHFGAETVALDWDETFFALQNGGVLGQRNALDAIRAARVDCVQRYLTVWNCVYEPLCLNLSAQFREKLSDEDIELFRAAAKEACAAEIAASRAQEEEILSRFRAGGVEVRTLTDEQIRAFRAAAEPVCEAWRELCGGEALAALGYSG